MDRYLFEDQRLLMERRSRNFAIASLACAILLNSIPFIAVGLGFFAILFAVLSKGYNNKISKQAWNSIKVGAAGIVIAVSMTAIAIYRFFNNTEYRNNLFNIIDEFYGSYYIEEFGEKPSDMFNELLGGDYVDL